MRTLEDNPYFNAARGASLTLQGEAELDAAIMDGRALRAGAVGGGCYGQNPVALARALLEHSPYVFLTDEGTLEHGLPLAPPGYFQTAKTQQQWLEPAGQEPPLLAGYDTVGAVPLDWAGNLAVATSTGGLEGQRQGRVGDSLVLGGGTYQHRGRRRAVSCTGNGELIMRGALAHKVYALVRYKGLPLADTCQAAVHLRDDKGFIALDPSGNVGLAFSTNVMRRRAHRVGEAEPYVAIFRNE